MASLHNGGMGLRLAYAKNQWDAWHGYTTCPFSFKFWYGSNFNNITANINRNITWTWRYYEKTYFFMNIFEIILLFSQSTNTCFLSSEFMTNCTGFILQMLLCTELFTFANTFGFYFMFYQIFCYLDMLVFCDQLWRFF
jgi:hypothetical protein